jgi:3-octaprenyl-4-hydroxybenzoate carboxy-lyase N-terminal domain
MAYRSFHSFLDALEKAGELKRVAIPVDTDLLIAEWADREMKSPGRAVGRLFCSNSLSSMEKNQNSPLQSTPWDRAAEWRSRCRFQTSKTWPGKFNSF